MADPVSEETMTQRQGELKTRLDELSQERMRIERELYAISLYLDAIKGELKKPESLAAHKPEHKSHHAANGIRAPRGERRGAILEILKQAPSGHTFERIVEILDVNEREKKAVYATLHNMKRKGDITQHSNKHFVLPPTEEKDSEAEEVI